MDHKVLLNAIFFRSGSIRQRSHFIFVVISCVCYASSASSALGQTQYEVIPRPGLHMSRYSGPPPTGTYIRPLETSDMNSSDEIGRGIDEKRMAGWYPSIFDPGTFVNGQAEHIYLRILDYAGQAPALPSIAQAAVVGVVTKGTAFVSRDHTYVYSDFSITVDEILRQDSALPISSTPVIGQSPGGSIQFPSGHITHYVIKSEGFPIVGGHYLFFLWRPDNQIVNRYAIVAAYQIEGDVVHPLVDRSPFTDYDNMSATKFLNEVRAALSTN